MDTYFSNNWIVILKSDDGKLRNYCEWVLRCPFKQGVEMGCATCPADSPKEKVNHETSVKFWQKEGGE